MTRRPETHMNPSERVSGGTNIADSLAVGLRQGVLEKYWRRGQEI